LVQRLPPLAENNLNEHSHNLVSLTADASHSVGTGARHLVSADTSRVVFATVAAAIVAVILNSFPLLTASLLAASAAVLTRTVDPAKAFAGFANPSVLLVVVAFLVANGVVKIGTRTTHQPLRGKRIRAIDTGIGYSNFVTDAMIARRFQAIQRAVAYSTPLSFLFFGPKFRLHAHHGKELPNSLRNLGDRQLAFSLVCEGGGTSLDFHGQQLC
jgi:di/tricarboxylate transporter